MVHHTVKFWVQPCSYRLLCVGEEKRAWYTLFVHAQIPQNIWVFGNFHKICFVTLTSVRHADFSCIKDACHWPRSLQTMTRERRMYSVLRLQELSMCSSIPGKRCSTWMTQSFRLKFTDHLEWSIADCYHQSDIVFDFNIARMCSTGSITTQCGLSGGEQKLTVILV